MQFSQEVTRGYVLPKQGIEPWMREKGSKKKNERQRETVVCTRFRNNYQSALDKEDGGLQEECLQEKNAT